MIKIISLLIICSFIVSCSSSAKRVIASEDLPDNTYYGAIDMRKTWDCSYSQYTPEKRSCSCAVSASDVILRDLRIEYQESRYIVTYRGLNIAHSHDLLHAKYVGACTVNIAKIITEERRHRVEEIANSSSRIKNDIIWDPELLDTLLKQLEKRKK